MFVVLNLLQHLFDFLKAPQVVSIKINCFENLLTQHVYLPLVLRSCEFLKIARVKCTLKHVVFIV